MDKETIEAMKESSIDLVAGVLGGSAGIIVGQPFDTIKVRLQTHSSFYKGAMDCASQTLRQEGVSGFFKGLSSPLFGTIINSAIVFGAYGTAFRYLHGDNDSQSELSHIFAAGSFAGFLQCIAVTPTELVKCRLQVQDGHSRNSYKGPLDCIAHLYGRSGIRGLYLGWWPTVCREVPSFGIYFGVYEATKRQISEDATNPSYSDMLIAGGCSGVASWASTFPIDVIKSSVQTIPEDAPASERRMLHHIKTLYANNGLKAFSNGLGTTLLRAFPVNAVTLFIYEFTVTDLNQRFLQLE